MDDLRDDYSGSTSGGERGIRAHRPGRQLRDLAPQTARGRHADILDRGRNRISDPGGIEGPPSEAEGLGLLDIETVIEGDKSLSEVVGVDIETGEAVTGYEMHIGKTSGPGLAQAWLRLEDGREEGARSSDGRVRGSYLHGIFAADGFRHSFLERLGFEPEGGVAYDALIEQTLDALAQHLETHLDLDRLLASASPVKTELSATG